MGPARQRVRQVEEGHLCVMGLRSAFPLHIQSLVGTWAVRWLFRLVGLVWLVLGACHVLGVVDGASTTR